MNRTIRIAAAIAVAASVAALGVGSTAQADGGNPDYIKICNSSKSTGSDPISVLGGTGDPWLNPGECKRLLNDAGQARFMVYNDYKRKIAGYSYGKCRNGSRYGTQVNPPNVGKLYIKTLKGNPC